jgi:hypothetical protein
MDSKGNRIDGGAVLAGVGEVEDPMETDGTEEE